MPWRFAFAMVMMIGTLVSPALADEALLSDERWSESAFGMSLKPPAGAEAIEQTTDRALVSFLVDEDMSIRVYLRQTNEPVSLETIHARAVQQFMFSYPSAVIVQDDVQEVRIGQRNGARWYFLVPGDEGEWIAGQAFMMIDPNTFAMFQYESDAHTYERSRRIFEAVLESVELMPPDELDRRRTALIQAGHTWLEQIDMEQIEAALPERQFMRILENGQDVGYYRSQTERSRQVGESGLAMQIQWRTMTDEDHAYDSQQEMFLADNQQTEIWSTVTTLRPTQSQRGLQPRQRQRGLQQRPQQSDAEASRQPPREQSWADTGLRSHDRINVSREGPTQIDNREWDIPPKAYLSQVAVQALPALLAEQARTGNPPPPMAFYAYHPNANRITLRATRIEPGDNDTWRVYDRPAPDRAEQTYIFDRRGRLIERHTGDDRVYKPATDAEIQAIWR